MMGCKSEREALQALLKLQRRNMHLWAVTTIVMVSLAAGLLSVTWHPAWASAEWHGPAFLPQAMIGLVVLIALLSGYLLDQKRRSAGAERDLIREALSSDNGSDLLDEETHVFQRRFLEYALAQERTTAGVEGTPTCAVLIRALQFIPENRRGKVSGGGFMRHASYLLRRTFRGADTIVRESDTSFLVLMSDTTSEEARCALNRLLENVNKWNLSWQANYEIVLSWQLAACTADEDLAQAVKMLCADRVEEEELERTNTGVPVMAGITI
jgi:GGDEF domain-containing protein